MEPSGRFMRLLRHCLTPDGLAARRFPAGTMDRIEARVTLAERSHGAEIRIAIESALSPSAILAGQSPRERALEVFGGLRVWDTEANNGVLVYLLLADHAVEIIADRAAFGRIDARVWTDACAVLAEACRERREEEGVLAAIDLLDEALVAAFPPRPGGVDEIPNRPIVV
ncbi:MAG: TPM domain-containing protein [Burkholderiaceae bacterium]